MRNPFRRKSLDVLPEDLWQRVLIAQDMAGQIGFEQAVGLPAVLAVIRLISHTVGLVPLNVMRGDEDSVRTRARDTWQWDLLHRRPGPPPATPMNFKADIAAHFCGFGNAYVRKLKPSSQSFRLTREAPRVTELLPTNPNYVTPKRSTTGAVVYDDTSVDGKVVERGTDEMVQIRSFAIGRDGLRGVSPITSARQMVTAGLRRQQFENNHLKNGIFPGMAVAFPRGMTKEQAREWLDFLEERHRGDGKAGKAIGLPDGSNVTSLPLSLQDALFAEMTRLTMEQAAAMYQVPLAIVTPQRRPITDDDWRHFTSFAVAPVIQSIAEAFNADDDLFKPGENDELSVIGEMDGLLRLDPQKKAEIQHNQVQDGTRLVDELRNADGYGDLPPVPDDWSQAPGKVPQITPVGGAANPEIDTSKPSLGASEGDPIGQDNGA